MHFIQNYKEYFYINGVHVSCKKFEERFEKLFENKTFEQKMRYAERIIGGEEVVYRHVRLKYEERNVKTGELKEQKYKANTHCGGTRDRTRKDCI